MSELMDMISRIINEEAEKLAIMPGTIEDKEQYLEESVQELKKVIGIE